MKILLSEHHQLQIFRSVENQDENRTYLSEEDFLKVKIEDRRKVFSKVFPYQLINNFENSSYDFKADYYVGIDWLVEGKKFVQVEPKLNKKLLEIYERVTDEEIAISEHTERDKFNRILLEQRLATGDSLVRIDYLRMLLDIYGSEISPKEIGNLVEIYWDDAKIKIQQKDDYLTPFLVVQFLSLLKTIVRKGLKKSYYKVQENLTNRVKGKILVGQHIKQNVFKNRLTSTYCEYQVFGENSLENQFLKKVFQFCTSYVENNIQFFKESKTIVENTINYIRPAFWNISELREGIKLHDFKNNPFFKEYKEAIQIGNYILKRFAYNISATSHSKEIETPPFWIDMPRLFELYFYQKLLKANSDKTNKIKYQFATHGNSLDFLIKDKENSIIIDTKYKVKYEYSHIHEDIRQVSGYARLKRVRNECGIYDDSNIACLIIYPLLGGEGIDLSLEKINEKLSEENEIKAYHKVYKLGIILPII